MFHEPRYDLIKDPKSCAIIAAAFSGGQPRSGVEFGPEAIVQHGLCKQLEDLGWKVHHDGVIHRFGEDKPQDEKSDPPYGIVKRPRLVGGAAKSLSELAYAEASQGRLVITLGGDHSIAMGSITGVAKAHPDLAVIWVDAHADINTPESSSSGNMHGMPVSFLLGLVQNPHSVPGFEWFASSLKKERIVYIGLRDVDQPEKKILKEHNIKCYSMHEVDRYGIGQVVDMALKYVDPDGKLPLHLSFDVDALDPSVAPATGTPVRGGLTFREGHYICEAVALTGRLVGLDVVEVNPLLTVHEREAADTVSVGCSLTRASLGETLL